MPEITNHKFKPTFGKETNIESLISAPLVAASKANVVMATGQTKFILDYCFVKKGDSYEPIMIEMLLTKNEVVPAEDEQTPARIKQTELVFGLPLLTIVPMVSLAVNSIDIEFDLELTSTTSKDSDHGLVDKKAHLNGRLSSNSNSSNSKNPNSTHRPSHLKVNMNASPLPLPSGVLTILDLYTKNIAPLEKNKEKQND